jgi:outer membrane protein TolC
MTERKYFSDVNAKYALMLAGVVTLAGCATAPQPLEQSELDKRTADLLSRYVTQQEPVTTSIDLYEAMARAIKYNLDYRVEIMSKAVRTRDLDLKSYDMLPKLVASLDYSGRSNDSGGSSQSLSTGKQSLESSTSSDRNVRSADLTMSWDVLDFGLSYVRQLQAGDEVMIAEQRKRKVIQRITEDVRSAFWRAASAQQLQDKMIELERSTQLALDKSQAQRKTGTTRPMIALSYERDLLSIRRDLQSMAGELSVAKQQLAALMNLPPNQKYTIVVPQNTDTTKTIGMPYSKMLQVAVNSRPELREVAYQLRSNERESTVALLKALPNLKLFIGADWTSNSFLYNNNWGAYGAQSSWNLLNVFKVGAERDRVKAQGQLLDSRSLALTMAVAVQVSVSRARYEIRQRELDTAERSFDVQKQIVAQTEAGYNADSVSQQTLIREEMNTLVSEARLNVARAEQQSAYANVYSSMGIDAVDSSMSSHDSVKDLSGKLRHMWTQRNGMLASAEKR